MALSLPGYGKLLGLFWQTALAAELEYRLNFVLASFSSLANLAGSLFSLFLFYRTGYSFQGWSWQEALLVLGLFTIFQGLAAALFIPNLNRIVEYVEKGTLDFVLLKPVSSQFWLSGRILSPWGLPDFLLGFLLIAYASYTLNLNALHLFLGFFLLLCGAVSLYSLWFMLGATSIWFVKIYNVTEVLRGLLEAGRYPMAAYPPLYRLFFTVIIPVAFLTTVPAEAMLGKLKLGVLLIAFILALLLLCLSHYFWRFALKFYTSASS
ncbi:MAG: ABC transporter permease [Cyanobacteria bacterium RI_101]|nr:ABC transporter permease [Cyanobacteria bacterium RI_101]